MSEIELRNVSKLYGSKSVAVDNVSLDIKDGEFMVLLGPSGCGKSSTLRMIAGLEEITSGDIIIDGVRINDVDPAERDLAIVFQNYALYPHMNIDANLAFGLKLRKIPKDEIDRRISETAKVLGIGDLLSRRPRELSGGQQQRVALGRALIREPIAFLFDEPLSNLDAKLRATMRMELVKLHRELGTTIVHVTHDQVEAMTMGDRICIMLDGHVEQVGAPLEVYRNPANMFVAGFLGSPPMNLIEAELTGSNDLLQIKIGEATLDVPTRYRDTYSAYANKKVIFGIRPEDLYTNQGDGSYVCFEAHVVAIEALGPETIMVGQFPDGKEITSRLDRSFTVQIGSTMRLYADLDMMHLFDPQTEKIISKISL